MRSFDVLNDRWTNFRPTKTQAFWFAAACVAATCMNPLPPARSAALWRADISGSSGRGNGMRSITTSRHESPGTSTPCQSDSVPNRQVAGSAANAFTRAAVRSSPWQSTGTSSRSRICSAAASAARIDENRPSVRPPAASIRASGSLI